MPMYEMTVRASSLSDFLDCALRWRAVHLLKMKKPTHGAAHIGTSIHAGAAAYDAAVVLGAPISADDATSVLVDTLHNPEDDVDWDSDMSAAKAEPIVRTLLGKYIETIAPKRNYVAVEQPSEEVIEFDVLRGSPAIFRLTLTGTIDRVRQDSDGRLGITDLKSGKSAVNADGSVNAGKHAAQLGAYALLASGIFKHWPLTAPAEIIGLQTNGKARVGSGYIQYPSEILIGDEENYSGILQLIAHAAHNDLFLPNPSSRLCSSKFCVFHAKCPYRR